MPVGKSYVDTCLNPWTESPAGVADEFSMPTSCLKFRCVTNGVSSTGNGNVLTIINPWATGSTAGVGTQFLNVATFTASSNTIASYSDFAHPDVVTINQNFDRFRTVSAGVKVYYTGAEQTTSGTITIIPIVSVLPSLTTMPTDAAAWTNLPGARTVAAAAMTEPLCGAFHSYDRPRFHFGTDVSGNAWFPSFAILGLGLQATSAVLRIELEVNLEVIPRMITPINANSFSVQQYSDGQMSVTRRLDSTRVGNLSQVTSMKVAGIGASMRRRISKPGVLGKSYKRKRSPYKKSGTRKRRSMRRRR